MRIGLRNVETEEVLHVNEIDSAVKDFITNTRLLTVEIETSSIFTFNRCIRFLTSIYKSGERFEANTGRYTSEYNKAKKLYTISIQPGTVTDDRLDILTKLKSVKVKIDKLAPAVKIPQLTDQYIEALTKLAMNLYTFSDIELDISTVKIRRNRKDATKYVLDLKLRRALGIRKIQKQILFQNVQTTEFVPWHTGACIDNMLREINMYDKIAVGICEQLNAKVVRVHLQKQHKAMPDFGGAGDLNQFWSLVTVN